MKSEIREHVEVINSINDELLDALQEVIRHSTEVVRSGGKLLFCGNGGSAADAQHLAAEFVVRFRHNRRALAAIALTTDTSVLTATGNDFSYDEVFKRQVEALGLKGDVLFAISTSGNSPNVIKAAEQARSQGLTVVGITGSQISELGKIADYHLAMPTADTARIQECYMLLGHILCGEVEKKFVTE